MAGCCKCGIEPSGSIICGELSWLAENRLASQELCSMECVPITRTSHIDGSKDVRIRGHFSKPKGVLQQKRLGNTEWSCICIRLEGILGVGVEV